ncbi:hypothetical protein C8Q77DRAFT_911189 [Trametes polyzona]|nr:hypothetical protein C8Q77DRAFT_911189 [Trametes polyzona]
MWSGACLLLVGRCSSMNLLTSPAWKEGDGDSGMQHDLLQQRKSGWPVRLPVFAPDGLLEFLESIPYIVTGCTQ